MTWLYFVRQHLHSCISRDSLGGQMTALKYCNMPYLVCSTVRKYVFRCSVSRSV